jgi:hypothetical protein
MWIEKLAHGILELDTPIGPRYLQPNFVQRVVLMWTFRNFFSLPQQVLRGSERRLIDRLLNENRFVSVSAMGGATDRPVIGRIERRALATIEVMPPRKPMSGAQSAVAKRDREAASA